MKGGTIAGCLVLLAFSIAPPAQSALPDLSAIEVISKWNTAVHASSSNGRRIAHVVWVSDQDGISGNIEEWIGNENEFHEIIKRKHDFAELLLAPGVAERRDWNGYLRKVEGRELSRSRSAAFEFETIALGPPSKPANADVAQSEDGKFYLLSITPPAGEMIHWYMNPENWLPVKSVRDGNDTEITTNYDAWHNQSGVLVPTHIRVNETEKPTYELRLLNLKKETRGSATEFGPLRPGPLDVRMSGLVPPIPFNFENAHILFKARLNGSQPIWFLLDTGADQEVINEPRMEEFGLKSYAHSTTTGGGHSAEYGYAKGATFSLPGGVEIKNQHVAVLDQSGLETAFGMKIGGILGYDFISRFVLEIDYQKAVITLHDPKSWSYNGKGHIVPIIFDEGIPFVNGNISVSGKQIPAFFVLDFGAAETATLTPPFVKAQDLLTLAQTNATVNRPAGLEKQFFAQTNVRGHLDRLFLGELAVSSIPINLSMNTTGAYSSKNFSGTVGEGIFHRYHVFLDYARNRAIFEPTSEAEKPFPGRWTYGLSLLASGNDLHTYTVSAVRPASPAEKDGLKKDDVITALDNKRSTDFTLGELRDTLLKDGKKHELSVLRGKETLHFPVTIHVISLDAK